MAGEPVEKIVSDRKRIIKRIEGEMRDVLSSMDPEKVMQVFNLLFS